VAYLVTLQEIHQGILKLFQSHSRRFLAPY
jgi:hypothetical protein